MRRLGIAVIAAIALASVSFASSATAPGPTIASPDGTRIAFTRPGDPSVQDSPVAIWTARSDGTSASQLTHPGPGSTDYGPAWSPDGTTIAFTRSTPRPLPAQPDVAVWMVAVANGTETRLTPPATDGAQPAWSPDGTRIAFVSGRDHDGRSESEDETRPNGDVYVMHADGSSPQRITHTRGPETNVTWSPSGNRLLYASAPASIVFAPFHLVLARSDGSCPTPIAKGQSAPAGINLDAVADPIDDRFPNEALSASVILRSLRATGLPRGARLDSVRFARFADAAVPEIIVRVSGTTAVGRLFAIRDRLLESLQLDQGVYFELRNRCGALLGAVGAGELGTRARVGVARAAPCR